jgi:hypothetical protein
MAKTKTTGPAKAPVPTPMPADWDAAYTLAALLVRHEVLTRHEVMSDEEVAHQVFLDLSPDAIPAVTHFVRSVGWLAEKRPGVLPVVNAADVTWPAAVPTAFIVHDDTVRVRDDIATVDAIRAWTDPEQITDVPAQLALVEEAPGKSKVVTELAFSSGDEVASVSLALADRAEALEKEAKKLTDLGRHAEAKALVREAKHIREALLVQLESQRELPFNTGETVLASVTRVVGSTVRTALVRSVKTAVVVGEGETYEEVTEKRLADLADFERIVGGVAEHAAAAVLPVLRDVAERAYEAGKASREQSAESLVRDAVQAHGAQRAAA